MTAVLQNSRVSCANGLNIFSLPSFSSGNVMLGWFAFWYGLVMFADQPKIYSATSTVRLIGKRNETKMKEKKTIN